jgi:hypothetical protein
LVSKYIIQLPVSLSGLLPGMAKEVKERKGFSTFIRNTEVDLLF